MCDRRQQVERLGRSWNPEGDCGLDRLRVVAHHGPALPWSALRRGILLLVAHGRELHIRSSDATSTVGAWLVALDGGIGYSAVPSVPGI